MGIQILDIPTEKIHFFIQILDIPIEKFTFSSKIFITPIEKIWMIFQIQIFCNKNGLFL